MATDPRPVSPRRSLARPDDRAPDACAADLRPMAGAIFFRHEPSTAR